MTKELDCLVTEIVQKTTTAELNQLISALNLQLEQREEKKIQKAKQAFINAYKKFRKLAPWEDCYISFQYEDEEFCWEERDLFELMDEAFLRGE